MTASRTHAVGRLDSLEASLNRAVGVDARLGVLQQILAEFPLLYGYWLQFIEATNDKAAAWRDALDKCPTLELWVAFLSSPVGESESDAENAVNAVGLHFQGHEVWDVYLERAVDKGVVLKKLVNLPLYSYAKYFQQAYEQHTESTEELARRSEVIASAVADRWSYESRITRFYFHPYDIETEELRVWDTYLDYVESEGDDDAIRTLYGRCLVATALYPEFWLRYIRWMIRRHAEEKALIRRIFEDALHYLSDDVQLLLFHARWLESQGEVDEAREYYQKSGDTEQLVAFDLRMNKVLASDDAESYWLELARQTGTIERLPARIRESSAVFTIPGIKPILLFEAWERGYCPDANAYAERLRDDGCIPEFFAVDKTLIY